MKLPLSRNENIIVQEVGKELLIYDLLTNKAYSLNETSRIIYDACDGFTSFKELKNKHRFTDDLIFLALDILKKENLIEAENLVLFSGVKRREMIKTAGLATLAALPLVSVLIAPTSAAAQSGVCRGTNPKGFRICTRGVSGCEQNVAQMCTSCSATATDPPVEGCADPFPFLCTCN